MREGAPRLLIVVASDTGRTWRMGEAFAEGAREAGAEVTLAYGAREGVAARHLLHAAKVAIEDVVAESPDAEDFAEAVTKAREASTTR